jgi:hypothetical protein
VRQSRAWHSIQVVVASFQHPFTSHRVFTHFSMSPIPTTLGQEAGLEPVLFSRTGLLVRRSHLGHLIRDQRGTISPHAGEGRGFYPSMAPRSLLPGKALGWWVSAPSHFPPRPLQGRLHPFGMRRGPPRAHSPPRPSRLDPRGYSPGRRPWGDGADCFLSLSG